MNALCQVWIKLAQWFWRRRLLNSVNIFSIFCYYLPLEKGMVLHLNKLESTSPKDALYQVWLKLAHWFWRRKSKCEKFTTTTTITTTPTTDNGRIVIRKAHLNLRLSWAKTGREKRDGLSIYSFRLYQSDLIQINTYLPCMAISEDFFIIFLGEMSYYD